MVRCGLKKVRRVSHTAKACVRPGRERPHRVTESLKFNMAEFGVLEMRNSAPQRPGGPLLVTALMKHLIEPSSYYTVVCYNVTAYLNTSDDHAMPHDDGIGSARTLPGSVQLGNLARNHYGMVEYM